MAGQIDFILMNMIIIFNINSCGFIGLLFKSLLPEVEGQESTIEGCSPLRESVQALSRLWFWMRGFEVLHLKCVNVNIRFRPFALLTFPMMVNEGKRAEGRGGLEPFQMAIMVAPSSSSSFIEQ